MPRSLLPRRGLALLVAAVVLLGAATLVGAVEEPRDRPATTAPPVTVYVSEELDISDVRMTDGGRIEDETNGGPVTFQRVNGTENVTVADPESANFTGVAPGSYDAREDDDDRPELDVDRPRVTSLVLRDQRSRNVTNRTVRTDRLKGVTVVAAYDFAEADRLQVTMRHEGSSVGLDQRAARITESGGRYTIGMNGRPTGTYTVTVTGSAIEAGSRSVTFELVAADATPTDTPTPTQTPTEGAGPGPGLVGALCAVTAALASLALSGRRRG